MLNYSLIVQKIQKVVSHYNKNLLWHRWKNVHAYSFFINGILLQDDLILRLKGR